MTSARNRRALLPKLATLLAFVVLIASATWWGLRLWAWFAGARPQAAPALLSEPVRVSYPSIAAWLGVSSQAPAAVATPAALGGYQVVGVFAGQRLGSAVLRANNGQTMAYAVGDVVANSYRVVAVQADGVRLVSLDGTSADVFLPIAPPKRIALDSMPLAAPAAAEAAR